MPSNDESISRNNNEEPLSVLDYQEENELSKEARINLGAKILASSGFHTHQKPIVESSFNKARKHGDKMPGNNAERRTYAYLSRLESLIEKHGTSAEKRLWKNSMQHDLLIEYDNIPETYWDAKRQELRDNGYGNIELTEEYKHEIHREERELQRQSLEKWANYLGDERSPYPLWFKIYAWDGMTKMGRYNKAKGRYEARNRTTVAPYPNPDAEILAGVFDVINRYYGNGEREFYTEEGERNIPLERIVQSGNFAKIYNAVQQDIAPIIEPPENAEEVSGEWAEYGLGDEDTIAMAARGTGWCVASPAVGRHYLKYGTYGDELDGQESSVENKARFILFHLTDSKTGKLAKNACASIRLDPDGNVAEISGLRDGQALDDSIVPAVEEKVGSLPGGIEFLQKFADKNELIRLDKKMQNGEGLTVEELRFIYELDRPIATLDTYNEEDPRIWELKGKYDIEYALNAGISADDLMLRFNAREIAEHLDTLISHGANANEISHRISTHDVFLNLETLLTHGADIDSIIPSLEPYQIGEKLDVLIEYGANVSDLVARMHPDGIAYNLDTLASLGVNINVNSLASRMTPWDIERYLSTLLKHGASANFIMSRMHPSSIATNLDILVGNGVHMDVNDFVSKMKPDFIDTKGIDQLLKHGANLDTLIDKLHSRSDWISQSSFDVLVSYGANPASLASDFQIVSDDEIVEE